VSLIINEELGFASGSSVLKPEALIPLGTIAAELKKVGYQILVEGHTDDLVSNRVDNMELSFRRALAISDYFRKEGVAPERLTVAGYGPYRPLAANATPEGRGMNRRVEINLIIKKEA
jgi:chemotaxis protein MotB